MTDVLPIHDRRPQWQTEELRAAQDLAPGLRFRIDQLRLVFLVDAAELRIVLPTGHLIQPGATIFNVPVVHADVAAPMVALGMT